MLLTYPQALEKWPDLVAGTAIGTDQETAELINDWFQFRYIDDNDKFNVFFRRRVNMYYPKYKRMADAEAADIDPLVNMRKTLSALRTGSEKTGRKADRSTERMRTGTGAEKAGMNENYAGTSENDGMKAMAGGEAVEKTRGLTRAEPESRITDGYDGYKEHRAGTDASADTSGSIGGARNMNKNMPQSISYEAAAAGTIPAMDWTHPGAQYQQDDKRDGTADASKSHEEDLEITGSKTRLEEHVGELEEAGTEQENREYRDRKDKEQFAGSDAYGRDESREGRNEAEEADTFTEGTAEAGKKDKEESETREEGGLAGVLESEAYMSYLEWLRETDAIRWFVGKLEICFSPFYNEEDNDY